MIYISHRGNINGKNPDRENRPDYIAEALKKDFNVEIDVWFRDKKFWLGHDSPEYQVDEIYLENEKLWCHAKNLPALEKMLLNKKIHCFWHQKDDVQLTSRGYIWTYPGKSLTSKSICVLPERDSPPDEQLGECLGICSDWIKNYGKN